MSYLDFAPFGRSLARRSKLCIACSDFYKNRSAFLPLLLIFTKNHASSSARFKMSSRRFDGIGHKRVICNNNLHSSGWAKKYKSKLNQNNYKHPGPYRLQKNPASTCLSDFLCICLRLIENQTPKIISVLKLLFRFDPLGVKCNCRSVFSRQLTYGCAVGV